MKFAWLSGDLRETCWSGRLLLQRFGSSTPAVQHLLTVLANAHSLGDIRAFRSLQLFLIPPTKKHQGRLLIRHKEIDMITELLTDDDHVVYDAGSTSTAWIDPIRRLRVISITSNA